MFFQLKVVTHERLKDSEGNLIQTVVALSLSDEGMRDISEHRRADEDQVLLSIEENPALSSRDRAQQMGWFMRSGDPYHMRVVRAEKVLEKAKLITKNRDGWELTKHGQQEITKLPPERRRAIWCNPVTAPRAVVPTPQKPPRSVRRPHQSPRAKHCQQTSAHRMERRFTRRIISSAARRVNVKSELPLGGLHGFVTNAP